MHTANKTLNSNINNSQEVGLVKPASMGLLEIVYPLKTETTFLQGSK
jgi:hypothetical protein